MACPLPATWSFTATAATRTQDINGFLFPSSGAEANEAAMRIARLYTGKHKIMTRYRSYHGGTAQTMAMTGDFRPVHRPPAAHTRRLRSRCASTRARARHVRTRTRGY